MCNITSNFSTEPFSSELLIIEAFVTFSVSKTKRNNILITAVYMTLIKIFFGQRN